MSFRNALIAAALNKPYKRRLQYLESTDTQYIDTGVIPTNTTTIEVNFAAAFCGTAPQSGKAPFGVFDIGDVKNCYGVYVAKGGGWYFPYGSNWPGVYLGADTDITKVRVEDGKVYLNDVLKGSSDGDFTCTGSLILFAARRVDQLGVQFKSSGKVSSCKILDGGTKLRDFIPVLWEAGKTYTDGNTGASVTPAADKPGMYDTVTGLLFVNKGSNEFLYE